MTDFIIFERETEKCERHPDPPPPQKRNKGHLDQPSFCFVSDSFLSFVYLFARLLLTFRASIFITAAGEGLSSATACNQRRIFIVPHQL